MRTKFYIYVLILDYFNNVYYQKGNKKEKRKITQTALIVATILCNRITRKYWLEVLM